MCLNKIVQNYSSNPSITKIREKFCNSQNIGKFQFNSVTTLKILKLLKKIEDKKTAGTDKIPPKLVKLSVTVLSQLFLLFLLLTNSRVKKIRSEILGQLVF